MQARRNFIHGLLIRDFFPGVLASFTNSLEGSSQSIGVIVNPGGRYALVADVLCEERVVMSNDALKPAAVSKNKHPFSTFRKVS